MSEIPFLDRLGEALESAAREQGLVKRRFEPTWLAGLAAFAVVLVLGVAWWAIGPFGTSGVTTDGTSDPIGGPTSTNASPACPNLVDEVVAPTSEWLIENASMIDAAHERLLADRERLLAWGRDNPASFGGMRWASFPQPGYVVGLVGETDEHCTSLRALTEYPDDFSILASDLTVTQVSDLRPQIREFVGSAGVLSTIRSEGNNGSLEVSLTAQGSAAAQQLLDDYGLGLEIIVGALPFPLDPEPGTLPSECETDPNRDLQPPTDLSLAVSVVLDTQTVVAGEDGRGSLRIENTDTRDVTINSGIVVGVAYALGGDSPLGIHIGVLPAPGSVAHLAPGESTDLPLVFGTASCDASLGYVLMPGNYEVRAAYAVSDSEGFSAQSAVVVVAGD